MRPKSADSSVKDPCRAEARNKMKIKRYNYKQREREREKKTRIIYNTQIMLFV